jgi:membrane fusion protein (multidrug efflux system)
MRALVDNSDGYLMAGSFVRVVLNDIVQKNVITIPQKAVLQNPLGTIVFVEDNGKVGVKPIIIGNETGENYVVAGGPLQSGDKVIVNNFFRLKPGTDVVVDKIINQQGK